MNVVRTLRVCALIALVGVATPALADSPICRPLFQQLAALGGDRAQDSARSDRAMRQELAETREQARRAGCNGGGFFFRKRPSKSCGALLSRINRLQRQVSSSRPRGFFFSTPPRDLERQRIQQALRRNGCTQQQPQQQQVNYGTYRTICVRTCDGYYFPMSFATSRQRFKTDAERCSSEYAPGEAELYYHPNPGGDASQAVSTSGGERYLNQPFAFAYRSAFQPQCAARLHAGLSVLGDRVLASLPKLELADTKAATDAPAATVPIPIARADLSEDPETVANRAGDFVLRPIMPSDGSANGDTVARVVGDPYYFAEANPGPPETIAGYTPPELRDFRQPQKASMLPGPALR